MVSGGGGGVVAQIPTSFGHELRACLRCRLVKTYDQFRESGCENCPFFGLDKDHERVVDCTTPNFSGLSVRRSAFSMCLQKGYEVSRLVDVCQ